MLRQGTTVVWRSSSEASNLATVDLPRNLPPGAYRLEAITPGDSRALDLQLGPAPPEPKTTLISFNANLAPAQRLRFLGHQWLLRGNLPEARRSLEASLREGTASETQVELARLDLAGGNLDAARDRLRAVLARTPDHFEALTVYGSIEAQLQDYPVAAEYYRKALAIQDSPAVRAALAQLPAR
jgi:tetratricopeptide (TPR) repeat protein